MNKFTLCLSVLAASFSVHAQPAEDIPASIRACASLDDDLRRLVCYDRAIEALTAPSKEPSDSRDTPPQAPAAEAVTATPDTATNPSGVPGSAGRPPPAPPAVTGAAPVEAERESREAQPDEYVATVSEIGTQPRGEHFVVMDNGEVWQEVSASRYFPVEAGDEVTIRKRMFGGHLLVTPSGKGFGVRRIR